MTEHKSHKLKLSDTEKKQAANESEGNHEHRDPLTGTPGAHPVGTGIGAAGAGAAGAAIGSVAGPVGALAGAALGAVVGGLIGKGVAEGIDPTEESAFWRESYKLRPYYDQGFSYDTDYEPAYKFGWETRKRYQNRKFEEVEPELKQSWQQSRAQSRLDWENARPPIRDAWERIETRNNEQS